MNSHSHPAKDNVPPEDAIARVVMDHCFDLHRNLGPGLFEVVYEVVLAEKLRQAGFAVQRQLPIPIVYEGMEFDEGFKADLIVDDKVLIELKSVEELHPRHFKQVLTYIRLRNYRLGLLINFGDALMKDGFRRIVNGLPEDGRE